MARTRDPDAGASIIDAYERYAIYAAVRFVGMLATVNGVQDEKDLAQVGRGSILKQGSTFNPELGNRFLSYASRGIQGDVTTERIKHGGGVYIPSNITRLLIAYRRLNSAGEKPEDDKITELLDIGADGVGFHEPSATVWTIPKFRTMIAAYEAESLEHLVETEPHALDSAQPTVPNIIRGDRRTNPRPDRSPACRARTTQGSIHRTTRSQSKRTNTFSPYALGHRTTLWV